MKHLTKVLWWARIKFFSLIFVIGIIGLGLVLFGVWRTPTSYDRLGLEQLLFGLGAVIMGYSFCRLQDRFEKFFKQKTTKLICSILNVKKGIAGEQAVKKKLEASLGKDHHIIESYDCVLYTSDAADE